MKLLIFISSIPGLFTITFIILKVLKIIKWAWIIIFSPLWIVFLSSMILIFSLIFYVKIYKKIYAKFFK
jgi:hypothetical protein